MARPAHPERRIIERSAHRSPTGRSPDDPFFLPSPPKGDSLATFVIGPVLCLAIVAAGFLAYAWWLQ